MTEYRITAIAPFCLMALFFCLPLSAGEDELHSLGKSLLGQGDYFNAVTELKRYQAIYPKGRRYRESRVLLGEAYLRGGNYPKASEILAECRYEYLGSMEGERALWLLTGMRILNEDRFPVLAEIQKYRSAYPAGKFMAKVEANYCYARALSPDLEGALAEIERYRKSFPGGGDEVNQLESLVRDEINRPQKSIALSVMGSVLIPGFGFFYTGDYSTGFFSFMSNALLIYLIWNAVRIHDTFQIVFFSLIEFSFYQYSIYGAFRGVREYNSAESFYRKVRLSFAAHF